MIGQAGNGPDSVELHRSHPADETEVGRALWNTLTAAAFSGDNACAECVYELIVAWRAGVDFDEIAERVGACVEQRRKR